MSCPAQIDFGDAKPYEDDVYEYSWEYGVISNQPDVSEEIIDGQHVQVIDNKLVPEDSQETGAALDAYEPDFSQLDEPRNVRRDTFVGTPLYVSPEMLHETKSLPASDLWALGCIIYRMHVGKVPFEDRSETGTFDKILNRQLEFPPEANLTEATKDVVDRLLQVNPKRRLGAGRPGTDNDLQALKNHEYFQGIDFASLHL